jgi:hypothetical protein
MGGMQRYTGAIQSQRDAELQKRKDAYNEQMMSYNMTQAETARLKAETDRAKLEAAKRGREAEAASGIKMMKALYPGQDFAYEDMGDDWSVMPVSNPMQGQMVKSETGQLGIDFGNYNKGNVKMFGLSEEDMQDIATIGQYDPKRATSMLADAFKARIRGTKEARDAIAKERAIAEAMNMPVGDYLRQKMIKQPLVDMRGASFGGNATLPRAEEASKAAGKEFGKFAMEAVQGANSAFDVANDIQIVEQGLKGMGGGPVAEFKAWAGKVMPGDSEWGKMASMNDLAKTIQVKLAPTMRAAGSGATSDFEMKAFMAAIPSLSTTEKGRSLMARYAQKIAERAQIRAEIVNEIEQSGSLPTPRQISDRMKARLGDRFFDDKDKAFFGIQAAPQQQARPAPAKPASSGGGWKDM